MVGGTAAHAGERPDRSAVLDGDRALTYAGLHEAACRLANVLCGRLGVRPHCRALLADFKCPRTVLVVDTVARDPNGKVRKGALRDWLIDRVRT